MLPNRKKYAFAKAHYVLPGSILIQIREIFSIECQIEMEDMPFLNFQLFQFQL
jgi:hypothetical protein